jgi:hypothetical protein
VNQSVIQARARPITAISWRIDGQRTEDTRNNSSNAELLPDSEYKDAQMVGKHKTKANRQTQRKFVKSSSSSRDKHVPNGNIPPGVKQSGRKDERGQKVYERSNNIAGDHPNEWSSYSIVLFGYQFDPDSIGKWIRHWTEFAYGVNMPVTDMAKELQSVLLDLARKLKRADEVVDRVRVYEKLELVEDFIESAERLWIRFKKLVKACEDFVDGFRFEKKVHRRTALESKRGVAFVQRLFGRDGELDKTERLMNNICLYSLRFEVNVEPIICHPGAGESGDESDDESEDRFKDESTEEEDVKPRATFTKTYNVFSPPLSQPFPQRSPATRLAIAWPYVGRNNGPLGMVPMSAKPILPEGWDWRVEGNQPFYIDTYAHDPERRCFSQPPIQQHEDSSISPGFSRRCGWERVCTVFGRIYWKHEESNHITYVNPWIYPYPRVRRGQLWVELDGGVECKASKYNGLAIEEVNGIKMVVFESQDRCEIETATWDKGISDEAVYQRGDLWWDNMNTETLNCRLTKHL